MTLDQKFPCVADMERVAQKRIPKFAFDYLAGGIGDEVCLQSNLSSMADIKFSPQYLRENTDNPDCRHALFGHVYDAPFGVAPIGFSGLIWPKSAEHLAVAAKNHNLPFTLSGFATSSVEDVAAAAEVCHWFQIYITKDDDINQSIIERAGAAGAEVLMVTVDIPTTTRRGRDMKNGLSVPPHFDLQTLGQIMQRPAWALASAAAGVPQFRTFSPYMPKNASLDSTAEYLADLVNVPVTQDRLKRLRDLWPGKLVVKGLLDPADAQLAKSIGADGIIISNHGGRQLDAALTAPQLIPQMRETVGPEMMLLADGGVRSGLDIARMLASGADFVLLGRAFMFAMAAMGPKGADHVMNVLKAEFEMTLTQIGCARVSDLSKFLT